jgi:hypothetical protein
LASAMLAGAMLWTYFLPGGLMTQARLMLGKPVVGHAQLPSQVGRASHDVERRTHRNQRNPRRRRRFARRSRRIAG